MSIIYNCQFIAHMLNWVDVGILTSSALKRATSLKTIHQRLSHTSVNIATFPKSWDISQYFAQISPQISLHDNESDKNISQPAGFEPARGNPIGFRVQRLNHSATTAR